MPQFLVTIHRPRGYDPATEEDDAMRRELDALNEAMVAAGARVFVGGLHPVESAIALVRQPDGKVSQRPGPYLDAPEHLGGLWVLEAAGLEEAVAWGRRAATACRANVEVREFH